ncbi:MAG: TAXI family TRAP transporter solute-binding subunit [Acidobacteriota bacterium]
MKPPQFEPDVGSSLSLRVIVASVVALLLIVGGFFGYRWLDSEKRHGEVIIATGPQSGTYQLLGLAFARVLESSGAVESAEVIETEGSVANMRLIGAPTDGADLAVVQGDTPPNEHVRLVAPLFEEVLHILVAKEAAEEITSIADLRGRTVSLGEEASGTRLLAERVLDHFRVRVGEDVRLSPQEASQALVDGKVEVAFILSAIPSRLIDDLAQMDAVRFLSLGDAEEHGTEAEALALAFSGV